MLRCMDTSSQRVTAAFHGCGSGAASDREPPGACSSSLSESELMLRQSAAAPVKRERFPGSPSEWLFATGS
jgi:hypothetical protein